mmetsp:Transcript_30028/g.75567  ORF Transcript_30028/g.75567 Transcript_30028/m.75567 type:complete len:204 (+) Transcript_30028:647-1258(+)
MLLADFLDGILCLLACALDSASRAAACLACLCATCANATFSRYRSSSHCAWLYAHTPACTCSSMASRSIDANDSANVGMTASPDPGPSASSRASSVLAGGRDVSSRTSAPLASLRFMNGRCRPGSLRDVLAPSAVSRTAPPLSRSFTRSAFSTFTLGMSPPNFTLFLDAGGSRLAGALGASKARDTDEAEAERGNALSGHASS